MKTKIEVLGFEIEIEEVDGKLNIEIERDDETIEELTLDPAEYGVEGEDDVEDEDEDQGSDVKAFDEFSGEEDEDENDSEDLPNEDEEDERALESFDSWASKAKKCDCGDECDCGDNCDCGDDCDCEKCK